VGKLAGPQSDIAIGTKLRRVEDARFVSGEGQFVDDIQLANMAHAHVLRSPHPHARIRGIDIDAARGAPGVLAILTGEDVVRDGLGRIQCPSFPTLPSGTPFHRPEQPVLAIEKVRHVGDRVAFVVAETLAQAKDAAELIAVDYDPLLPVPMADTALAPGAPLIWDEADSNLCFPMERGDAHAVDAAFKGAAHVTSIRIRYPRASANPMEPRSAIGRYQAQQHKYTLYTGSPQPHRSRALLADTILHVPESDIRVVTPDVGGAFGMRGTVYPEEVLVLWAARKLGRPVKWTGDRSECLMSDMHGRDQVSDAEIALDSNGRILALRTSSIVNVGAYLVYSAAVPPHNAATTTSGAYDIPHVHSSVRAVFTTTNPLGPYRGSGRPETTFVIERLIEKAARETGIESIELRRLNLIPASAMPYKTPGGSVMDCGDLARALQEALDLADWQGLRHRKAESMRRGLLRGFGVGLHAENAAQLSERVDLRIDSSGSATVNVGTVASGQSHETMYSQMVSSWLGIPLDQIRVCQGDTEKVAFGRGTLAARTAVIGGSALRHAADKVIERGKQIAALMLEASERDIEFNKGTFMISGTDRSVSLQAVAKKSYANGGLPMELGIGLEGQGTFAGPQTYPYGCMVCEVEVDPDTGVVNVDKFIFVDDVGIAINPMVVEGQTHGSIAQAAGQVLMEDVVFDPDSGQLLAGSFQDYSMPRADNFPFFEGSYIVIPTKTNPLGAKGGSETGSFGAPPAIINAVLDALSPLGVTDVALPATSERIWQAIVNARVKAATSGPRATHKEAADIIERGQQSTKAGVFPIDVT
jgi:carbon-monoxide dehydrogenase large subunit